jgi:hypothetical protein
MPQVRILRLPSIIPLRVGTTCAYLSWSISIIELNHLTGKPGDEPCMRDTVRVPLVSI